MLDLTVYLMMDKQTTNYYRIEKAISFLAENFREQPSLEEVAQKIHLSPFHFQRLFTDWVGISPKKFLQYLTVDYLRNKIKEADNLIQAADMVGLSAQSRVHDLFVSIEGVTPHQFKSSGRGLEIFYGYHPSPFGMCFIAVAEKGVCGLKFIDEEKSRDEYEIFYRQWHFARLVHKPDFTKPFVRKLFAPVENKPGNLHLLVQGTRFQIKVWEALLQIPFGSVASYQQIACMIQQQQSARAVASAAAKNSILYLIPCHRIISKDGQTGDYHYGKVRKKLMIAWELANSKIPQETD